MSTKKQAKVTARGNQRKSTGHNVCQENPPSLFATKHTNWSVAKPCFISKLKINHILNRNPISPGDNRFTRSIRILPDYAIVTFRILNTTKWNLAQGFSTNHSKHCTNPMQKVNHYFHRARTTDKVLLTKTMKNRWSNDKKGENVVESVV